MNDIKYTQKENGEGEKGFTLIEVLVAIAILSFGLIAMNFMQTQSVRGNAGAQILTEMTWIASDAIEGLLAEDYDDVETGDCAKNSLNALEDNICAGLPADYNVSWEVSGTDDVKSIEVTVTHIPTGKERKYDEYNTTNLLWRSYETTK